MISLHVHDIHHTQVDYRARKDVRNFIPCTVVLTGITPQKFRKNIKSPFSQRITYRIMFFSFSTRNCHIYYIYIYILDERYILEVEMKIIWAAPKNQRNYMKHVLARISVYKTA